MMTRFLVISSLIACGGPRDQGDDSGPMDGGVDVGGDVSSDTASDAPDEGLDATDAMGPPAQAKWQAAENLTIVAVAGDGQGGAWVVGDDTTNVNFQDVFIEHFDATGKSLLRRDLYGLSVTTRASAVARLSDGSTVYSLVASGGIQFKKSVMGDACTLSTSGRSLFLLRLTPSGACSWGKAYSGYTVAPIAGPGMNRIPVGAVGTGFAVAVPMAGGGINFTFEGGSAGGGETVARFDTAGAVQAVQRISDLNADGLWVVESIASDAQGNVYLSGRAGETVHFNGNTSGWGIFLARYTPSLTNVWGRFYGGWMHYGSVSGPVFDGPRIDITGNTIGLLAPIEEMADFGMTKITPKVNATAYAIARLATSDGAPQVATGAYSMAYYDSTSRVGGVAFVGSNLVVMMRPDVEIAGMQYPTGLVYAGFDAQLKPAWVKRWDGVLPIGMGANPGQQNAVVAGRLFQNVDFGLGPLMQGGFVAAFGAP